MGDLQAAPATRARLWARALALAALRRRGRPAQHGIRIVHYHYVFDDQREQFGRQIALLTSELEAISLTEAVRRLHSGTVTGREITVTFDDGFENQLTNAAPTLAVHGVQACFYLISDLVEATEARTDEICRHRIEMPLPLEPLSWEQVQELGRLGHELGSHTRTHPNLTAVNDASRKDELVSSKLAIEQRLGYKIAHFSAPFGTTARFSADISHAAREAGYASCATAQRGANESSADIYSLKRHHLVADWSLDDVRYFLSL